MSLLAAQQGTASVPFSSGPIPVAPALVDTEFPPRIDPSASRREARSSAICFVYGRAVCVGFGAKCVLASGPVYFVSSVYKKKGVWLFVCVQDYGYQVGSPAFRF